MNGQTVSVSLTRASFRALVVWGGSCYLKYSVCMLVYVWKMLWLYKNNDRQHLGRAVASNVAVKVVAQVEGHGLVCESC